MKETLKEVLKINKQLFENQERIMTYTVELYKMLKTKENHTGPMPLCIARNKNDWNEINDKVKNMDTFVVDRIVRTGNFELLSNGFINDEMICLLSKEKIANSQIFKKTFVRISSP